MAPKNVVPLSLSWGEGAKLVGKNASLDTAVAQGKGAKKKIMNQFRFKPSKYTVGSSKGCGAGPFWRRPSGARAVKLLRLREPAPDKASRKKFS